MSTIDIKNEKVEKIEYCESGYVTNSPYLNMILINDSGDIVGVDNSDIDNLIKALQKAKDIWGVKE